MHLLVAASAIAKRREAVAVIRIVVGAIVLAVVGVATVSVVEVAVHLVGWPLAVVVAWLIGLPSRVVVFERINDGLRVFELVRDLPMLSGGNYQCCTECYMTDAESISV